MWLAQQSDPDIASECSLPKNTNYSCLQLLIKLRYLKD